MRISLLLCFILLFLPIAYTQKKGLIKYVVTAEKQDTSIDAVMSSALLKKSEFTFTFKKKRRARVQLKAGTFFEFTTIFDHKKGQYLRLTDDQKNKVGQFVDIIVMPDTILYAKTKYSLLEDTMTIIGYKCRKAVYDSKYGKLTCWYTNEINHNFKQIEFLDVDVPGMPLYFESNSGKVNLTFKATSIDKLTKEDKKNLKLELPEGYILGTSIKK
jgi:GLPGLI family protein